MEIAKRRTLSVSIIIVAVVLATGYGLIPRAMDVDLVNVFRGPLQVTIEEEGRTRLKDRFVISAPTSGVMQRIEAKAAAADVIHDFTGLQFNLVVARIGVAMQIPTRAANPHYCVRIVFAVVPT